MTDRLRIPVHGADSADTWREASARHRAERTEDLLRELLEVPPPEPTEDPHEYT